MTPEEAIAALDALDVGDPESAHQKADDILRDVVPPSVSEAYERVIDRAPWWASA